MFQLVNDMGSLRASADSALELQSKIPGSGGLARNGLFVVLNGQRISNAEFRRLCTQEASKIA